MSRNKEREAWKEATEAENSKLTSNAKNKTKGKSKNGVKGEVNEKPGVSKGRRHAPFYKVMQGMPIAVDAFRYGKIPGVTAYLLTCVLARAWWAVKMTITTDMRIPIITRTSLPAGKMGLFIVPVRTA